MGGPSRARARRMTIRFIASAPGQFVLLATICLVAVAAALVAHAATLDAQERLAAIAARRYGWVRITTSADSSARAATLSHGADPLAWFTESAYTRMVRELAAIGLDAMPRIELAAFDEAAGRVVDLIAVSPSDPAFPAPGSNAASRLPANPAGGRLVIAVQNADGTARWITVPADEVIAAERDTTWVRRSWLRSVIGANAPQANVLVVAEGDGSAFSAAFDAAAALESGGESPTVLAWPELVGYEAYVGAGGSAGLLRPLVWIVATAAIAGAVAVSAHNRLRDVVVLRTLGFDRGAIRGVLVREVTLASLAAVAVASGALLFAGGTIGIRPDLIVRRTLLAGLALPPLVAFLALRRELRIPLARARREAEL